MFKFNKEKELDTITLQKMLNKFYTEVEPKRDKSKKYYDGLQEIINKKYIDTAKKCNRVVTNYCKNIADSYCGYIASPNFISYRSKENIEEIMQVLKYNDYQTEDADFLLNALIYGVAAELMYIDDSGKVRFKLIDSKNCFGIYDDSLTNDLLYFVRMYAADEWNDSDKINVDVYSNTDIKHYIMNGKNGNLKLELKEPHFFNQCPANILRMQDDKSVYDCVMSLQDAYNELLSSETDDYSAFCDAYLALTGVDADAEDIAKMKEDRVLILPENAKAEYIVKTTSDTQVQNLLNRIQESIYRIASCVDFNSEKFVGGVTSGIALLYRLTGMETRAGKIEAAMKQALQRRIELICGIASLKIGEEVFSEVSINFERNVPVDEASIINTVNSLRGVVSDATLLEQIPFVSDVNAELEAIKKQKEENMSLYNFSSESEESEEE